jgi:hypothetical protein
VCNVSAVSRGRSPGNCFPQLGLQLFVITGEAATGRSRSSPILMGWWSVQRSDYRSPLVELANTTISFKGSTKKRTIVLAQAASPSILGAFTHFLNADARCGSKPARWRCRVRRKKGDDAGSKLRPPLGLCFINKLSFNTPPLPPPTLSLCFLASLRAPGVPCFVLNSFPLRGRARKKRSSTYE